MPPEPHRETRMGRIDFTWMDIEDERTALPEHAIAHLAQQRVREKPQIAATEEAHRYAHRLGDADWEFHDLTMRRLDQVGPVLAGWETAVLARGWKNRRVILETSIGQPIEEPRCLIGDRKPGRAVSAN